MSALFWQIIEWMRDVCAREGFSERTLWLAADCWRRLPPSFTKENPTPYAFVCLMLVSKVNETICLLPSSSFYLGKQRTTHLDLLERKAFKALGFCIEKGNTPFDFLQDHPFASPDHRTLTSDFIIACLPFPFYLANIRMNDLGRSAWTLARSGVPKTMTEGMIYRCRNRLNFRVESQNTTN